MNDIWADCIKEAFEDAKIMATDDQIDLVTAWVVGQYENYGTASGDDIASDNLRAARQKELDKARADLQAERAKIICDDCNGSGVLTMYGGTMKSTSRCHKCNGEGRR